MKNGRDPDQLIFNLSEFSLKTAAQKVLGRFLTHSVSSWSPRASTTTLLSSPPMHSGVCLARAVAGAANYPEAFAVYIFHPAGIPQSARPSNIVSRSPHSRWPTAWVKRTMDTLNSPSASLLRFFSIWNHDRPCVV